MDSVVIVGASLAGLRAAETFRSEGFDGTITIIGDEQHLPYDRPPLSKQVLAGEWEPERTNLMEERHEAMNLDWRLGVRATGLDVASKTVALDDGSTITSDGVLIATGASPRLLPGTPDLQGIHVLRTLDDSLALRADLERTPQRVVVIGAGFIGAEVAATARERGLDVTMIEALPAPMIRGLGEEMGLVGAEVHRDHGVDLRLGVGVDAIDGSDRVGSVRLSDGSEVAADVVVVGIGVVPNTDWLTGSGLAIDNGVVCDATCLAAPGVAAAGDVARWHNERFDEVMRVEHWDNAVDQGGAAARRLLAGDGPGMPFTPIPWFWSDQYDRKIQLAGRSVDTDEVRVIDGSTEERRFTAIYRRGDRLSAVLAFNRPRLVMKFRMLIETGASWDDALAVAEEADG